jgi:sarcosine oxidase, subunit beta
MTQKTYDVIIIGAGIIGLACAYELSQAGATVCIVEKHLPGAGQSTKTGGGIRLAHNSKINVALTQMSLPVWNSFESLFGIDPRYREIGHLFMSSEQKIKQTFENQLKWHSDFNCPSIILDATRVKQKWSHINGKHFASNLFCSEGGYLDDHSVIQGYQNGAQRNGVKLYSGVRVDGLLWEGGTIEGVRTSIGNFASKTVINAGGADAGVISSYASVSIPFCSRRHELLILNPRIPVPEDTPWLIDFDNQVHLRPDGQGRVLVGGFLGRNDICDPSFYAREYSKVWADKVRATVSRSFGLTKPNSKIIAGWAGLYPGTPDYLPVIELTAPGFITAAGFSGTGLMHAPAVGAIVNDLVATSKTERFNIFPLRSSRFRSSSAILETSGF